MINLKLFNLEVKDDNDKEYPIYNIDMIDRVNIIIGLSGSGKTYLFDNLVSAETDEFSVWSYKCDVEIVLISELQVKDFKNIVRDNYGKLIIIDEDTVEDLRRSNKLDLIMKSKNYFLLLDRTSLVKNDVNINSVFELKSRKYKKHRVFDTIKVFNLSRNKSNARLPDIDMAVIEDSASGLQFWHKVLSKIYMPKFKRYGNGEVVKHIKYLLKKYEGNILVVLDYDKGAIMMRKIMIDRRIDKNRVYFMALESFEEVICNSEFILSKFPQLREPTLNYTEYIDYNYASTGKYFSSLLFRVVKVQSPLKTKNEKNATKFYEKGMKNFKECFIDDCCIYNKGDCKLFCNDNKKKAMLANKFEIYRKFI